MKLAMIENSKPQEILKGTLKVEKTALNVKQRYLHLIKTEPKFLYRICNQNSIQLLTLFFWPEFKQSVICRTTQKIFHETN